MMDVGWWFGITDSDYEKIECYMEKRNTQERRMILHPVDKSVMIITLWECEECNVWNMTRNGLWCTTTSIGGKKTPKFLPWDTRGLLSCILPHVQMMNIDIQLWAFYDASSSSDITTYLTVEWIDHGHVMSLFVSFQAASDHRSVW